jgi:hypothetical protein
MNIVLAMYFPIYLGLCMVYSPIYTPYCHIEESFTSTNVFCRFVLQISVNVQDIFSSLWLVLMLYCIACSSCKRCYRALFALSIFNLCFITIILYCIRDKRYIRNIHINYEKPLNNSVYVQYIL